jgi:hypothetical protein
MYHQITLVAIGLNFECWMKNLERTEIHLEKMFSSFQTSSWLAICSLNKTGSAQEECRLLIAFWKTIVMSQN